jgi:hypothetical protein
MTLYYSGHDVVFSLFYTIRDGIAYLVAIYQDSRATGLTKPTLGFTFLGGKLSYLDNFDAARLFA